MNSGRSRDWMWADAVDLIDRVQRLHQQSFAPKRAGGGMPQWEPPVDMIETDDAVMVLVALPGVDLDHTEAVIEDGAEVRTARIHRLELPQGRFERRLPLPAGRFEAVRRASAHGCLLVTLHKAQGGPRR